MNNINENNESFAPGLTTYTTSSEQGTPGKRGTSIHYANIDLSDNQNIDYISQIISAGLPMNDVAKVSDRYVLYMEGDYVIDSMGSIYRIESVAGRLGVSANTKEGRLSDTRKHYIIKNEGGVHTITFDEGYILFELDSRMSVLCNGPLQNGGELAVGANSFYIMQINNASGSVLYYKETLQ